MHRIVLPIVAVIAALGGALIAQTATPPSPRPAAPALPVTSEAVEIWSLESTSTWVKTYYPALGVQEAITFVQSEFDPEDDAILNEDRWKAAVQAKVPVDYAGPAPLDWENKWGRMIWGRKGEPDFDRAIANGIRAMRIAKALRPNAKWGFYNIYPMLWHETDEAKIEARLAEFAPLLREVNALYPSLYDVCPDRWWVPGIRADSEAVERNLRIMVTMAQGKEVIPYVWHRFEVPGQPYDKTLITSLELAQRVADIVRVQARNGDRIKRILWWGDDQYFFIRCGTRFNPSIPTPGVDGALITQMRAIVQREMPRGMTADRYIDDLHIHVLTLLGTSANYARAHPTGLPCLPPAPGRSGPWK